MCSARRGAAGPVNDEFDRQAYIRRRTLRGEPVDQRKRCALPEFIKLTLAQITLLGTYTYTMADLRATVTALHEGAFGALAWLEHRPLAEGAQAFADLHAGLAKSSKILLISEAA
jgi:hypothetical protein